MFKLKFAIQDLLSSVQRVWLFCICIMLGVALVMASTALKQMLDRSILGDMRALMGGDVRIEANSEIDTNVLSWMHSQGTVSLTRELSTMMGTEDDAFQLVKLLSTDQAYPLYGDLKLSTGETLQDTLSKHDSTWGVAIDPVLAKRLSLNVGDKVYIGNLELTVRALVLQQPDRRLNASWRGAPVLISSDALNESGLIHPASRIDYEYRVRVDGSALAWKQAFFKEFPDTDWEVQTFEDRSERIAERLSQVASGLLIVAFSTLFIGGLGVFNSVTIYLHGKRETIATLKAIGLRRRAISQVYLLQICMLSFVSSLFGIALGIGIAFIATTVIAQDIPMSLGMTDTFRSALVACLFGLITALCFSLPALGRSVGQGVSALFREEESIAISLGKNWYFYTAVLSCLLIGLVLTLIPNIIFGIAFVAAVAFCILLFDGLVRLLKSLAMSLESKAWVYKHAPLRFAMANLHQPGTPLRMTLLSMGSAVTLIVACSVVIFALLRLITSTIPQESPALILYDVFSDQKAPVVSQLDSYDTVKKVSLAPLVLARVTGINGQNIRDVQFKEADQQEMARDEHKLSYLADNIDGITITQGSAWENKEVDELLETHGVDFLLLMEDREANQMELVPGNKVSFQFISGEKTGLLMGIYRQKGIQTRFWFEAILSDGALEADINRYVGTVHMSDTQALALQSQLATDFPNVITLRTEELVSSASDLLNKATQGLLAISSVSVLVSLVVLVSVLSAGKRRQLYQATIMRALGARLSYIRAAIRIEYALLALIVTVFSFGLGSLIAGMILQLRMKIFDLDVYWFGLAIAGFSTFLVFTLGMLYLFNKLSLRPAALLREGQG